MATLKKSQRLAVRACMSFLRLPPPPILVTLTRVGPRKLDDDNLAAAFKYVRDQVAAFIGLDDGSPLYTWQYKQRTGPYGIIVEITPRGGDTS